MVERARIHFEVHGYGMPVVMLPGLASGIETWTLQVAALSPYFKCVLIDSRGSGRSDMPDSQYTTEIMAGDVLAVLDELGAGIVKILGFSLGGAIAQQVAIIHPERVHRMAVVNSFARVGGAAGITLDWWKELALRKQMDRFCSDLINLVFTTEYMKNHSREVMAFRLAMTARPPSAIGLLRQIEAIERHDTRARLNGIECPTLVVSASNDRVVPVELGEELAAGIPYASFKCISRSGHALFVEQAASLNESLIHFFMNIDTAPWTAHAMRSFY